MFENLKNRLKYRLSGISKETYDTLITVAIIILIGLASFGLGKLSGLSTNKQPIKIEGSGAISAKDNTTNQSASAIQAVINNTGQGSIVASKNGTKYYMPWCSGSSRIAETNKVYFIDEASAQKAGYSKASGCK